MPEIEWLSYPVVKQWLSDGTFHADVINHYAKRMNERSLLTDAHETTHMINNEIRNAHTSGRTNAFYVGDDKAFVTPEPGIRKSAVASYVPSSLRAMRYGTYVTGMTEWDDSPLYLFDEWISYVNGGRCGVDLVERNLYRQIYAKPPFARYAALRAWSSVTAYGQARQVPTSNWTDGVFGMLEFSVYGTADVMAIEAGDSGYFDNHPSFLPFVAWLLDHAYAVYAKGSVMEQFKWDKQDAYLEAWRTSSDAEALRAFMTKHNLGLAWLGQAPPEPHHRLPHIILEPEAD